jgi:hypothetical protein
MMLPPFVVGYFLFFMCKHNAMLAVPTARGAPGMREASVIFLAVTQSDQRQYNTEGRSNGNL